MYSLISRIQLLKPDLTLYDALTLLARSIHSEAGHNTGDKIPCTKTEACITIRRLVKKAEDGLCSPSYTIIPRSDAFKQVIAEASVRVVDI